MALITWREAFSVDNPHIDGQHKELIELVNQLDDGMLRGCGAEILQPVLDQLLSYTRAHFADEERMMHAARYPLLRAHKAEHDKLTKQVVEFTSGLKTGKVALTVHLSRFLRGWLQEHILNSDQEFAKFQRRHHIRPATLASAHPAA